MSVIDHNHLWRVIIVGVEKHAVPTHYRTDEPQLGHDFTKGLRCICNPYLEDGFISHRCLIKGYCPGAEKQYLVN